MRRDTCQSSYEHEVEFDSNRIGFPSLGACMAVTLSYFHKVLGDRWPTSFNYYLINKRRGDSAVV